MLRLILNKIRRFFGRKRKLRGGWTAERSESLRTQYGMDCENEIVACLVKGVSVYKGDLVEITKSQITAAGELKGSRGVVNHKRPRWNPHCP